MIIQTIASTRIALLGDPHMGKKFLHGVPLHRRGERERMQFNDLVKSLHNVNSVHVHITMGDLFDGWSAPYEVIWRTAQAYIKAARDHRDTSYVVLRGNHDAVRDLERKSAFDLFQAIVKTYVLVVSDAPVATEAGLVYMPWHPVKSAAELVEEHKETLRNAEAVFGHWDVVAVADDFNLIPAAAFKALGVKQAITGHDHGRRHLTISGLPVFVTGSMQPYSFAEDDTGDLYVTMNLEQFENTDRASLRNKCVRILLEAGETFTENVDCLQLRVVPAEEAKASPTTVKFEAFDLDGMLIDLLQERAVTGNVRDRALAEWHRTKAEA